MDVPWKLDETGVYKRMSIELFRASEPRLFVGVCINLRPGLNKDHACGCVSGKDHVHQKSVLRQFSSITGFWRTKQKQNQRFLVVYGCVRPGVLVFLRTLQVALLLVVGMNLLDNPYPDVKAGGPKKIESTERHAGRHVASLLEVHLEG